MSGYDAWLEQPATDPDDDWDEIDNYNGVDRDEDDPPLDDWDD